MAAEVANRLAGEKPQAGDVAVRQESH
ncbi:MAG: hypothetical protein RLZZ485_591, partial [Actinomycetota bacterium]